MEQSKNCLFPQKRTFIEQLLNVGEYDQQKLQKKAIRIIKDALGRKIPRADLESNKQSYYVHLIQTSYIWQTFMLIITYFFTFILALESKLAVSTIDILEIIFIILLCIDLIAETFHKSYETHIPKLVFDNQYFIKATLICLAVAQKIIEFILRDFTHLRPLLIFRCFLILMYDPAAYKALKSLLSSYKDIFVFIFCEGIFLIGFSMVANQIIQLDPNQKFDQFAQNYGNLGKTIYIMYVLSTYDAYPDNQLIAIDASQYILIFFILFIFLNFFFFVTIPTSILYNSFSENQSQLILLEQKQKKESLFWAFQILSIKNDGRPYIKKQQLTQIVYKHLYKCKGRYRNYVEHIINRLDKHNTGKIYCRQFVSLVKILQQKNSMLPPFFPDCKPWIEIQQKVSHKLKMLQILNSKYFNACVFIFIVTAFINSLLAIYTDIQFFSTFDNVLSGIFFLQISFKIIGYGIQDFFKNPWNKLDFILVVIGIILNIVPYQSIPHNSDLMFKLFRIFRIGWVFKTLTNSKKVSESDLLVKYKRLISQMAITITIVIRFVPLYLIAFYFLGVTGMQIFQNINQIQSVDSSPYNQYQNYSNFDSLLGSFLVFVQVLFEAGWSNIAFDHAYRYGSYLFVMLYFVLGHVVLVVILSELLKGISWSVYWTVHQQLKLRRIQSIKIAHICSKHQQFQAYKSCKSAIKQKQDTFFEKLDYENEKNLKKAKELQDFIVSGDYSLIIDADDEKDDLNQFLGSKLGYQKINQDSDIFLDCFDSLLSNREAQLSLKTIKTKDMSLDSEKIVRQTFLQGMDDIAQIYYQTSMRNIYGINFTTNFYPSMQPLLQIKSSLIDNLRYIFRYKFQTYNFFKNLCLIEDRFSNKLLRRGSIFKIVYQLRGYTNDWFTIQNKNEEYKEIPQKDKKLNSLFNIRFIEKNNWFNTNKMHQNQLYYGKDIFTGQREGFQTYIKKFFQSFQSLAISLDSKDTFFQYDPCCYEYDTFCFYHNISNTQIQSCIQKVMFVILSRQNERQVSIQSSSLSNFQHKGSKQITNEKFRMNQSFTDSLEKLRKLSEMDEELVDIMKLPKNHLTNICYDLKDILSSHHHKIAKEAQNVFKDKFNL